MFNVLPYEFITLLSHFQVGLVSDIIWTVFLLSLSENERIKVPKCMYALGRVLSSHTECLIYFRSYKSR